MVSKFLNCSILACYAGEEIKLNQKNCERSDGRNLVFLDGYLLVTKSWTFYLNSLQNKLYVWVVAWKALILILNYHRGFSSDCQLFSKDIKVLLTLKLKIRVSYKHTLFIAKTLLDNTIKNVNKYIGPILIHYYGLTKNCRKKKLVFVSDLYFLNEIMESRAICFQSLVCQYDVDV